MDECAKIGQGRYGHVRMSYGSVRMVDITKEYTRPFVSLRLGENLGCLCTDMA
ncbi:unnamed protein product [Brassica oleracea var. botrytis]